MLNIYVDGDACPVKEETMRVAERHKLDVYIVSNGGLRPVTNPKVHMIVVAAGADLADDWIAEHISDGDIAVTADILLAGRCLKKNAVVIGPTGNVFNESNIGNAVAGRALSAHLRELGTQSYNPSFTKKDRSQFLQTLENSIQTLTRS
jgi:hypothetical protein